ncbi:MAG: hypothetical protein K6E84_01950 [Lachnospiraceae bacterium]|nr:hypothetical protein [Lachnospiraceae bacterium]
MSGVVDSAAINALNSRVKKVEDRTTKLEGMMGDVNENLREMKGSLRNVDTSLKQLIDGFNRMMNEQKRTADLQGALTELVRVRQEIEQRFGNYKIVRENMLGILQATDVALVKKTTISRISEELMLSTPDYWLAPCLVAVAAWIGNDRDLADRAIREAIKRDEEKTALTMALICRRNNRVDTCFEWLSIYFRNQSAANFSEGSFAYIDAYVNGIFGDDDKHMCDDYITRWINEIRGNSSNFESEQEEMWKSYCERFKMRIGDQYPLLAQNIVEFPQIDAYLGRIESVDSIAGTFTGIREAYVDQDNLKKKIDSNLISLINRFDGNEIPLRNEERFLLRVKEFNGDVERARAVCEQEERDRKEHTLNLVEQMTHAIISDDDTIPSQKKTAVSFLSGYIKKGFDTYINENKQSFPEQVTIKMGDWSGQTTDGSNIPALTSQYESYLRQSCEREKAAATTNKPQGLMIGAIVVGVISLLLLFGVPFLGIVGLIVAGVLAFNMNKEKKEMAQKILDINAKYEVLIEDGKKTIAQTATQWVEAKEAVDRFNNSPTREIIAS